MSSLHSQLEQLPIYRWSESDFAAARREAAQQLFARARRRASLAALWAWVRGGSSALPGLDDVFPGAYPASRRPASVQTVALAQIVASEGRSGDFDRRFAPLRNHLAERWLGIAVAWMSAQPLPPVHLIELDGRLVVRDGHHRLSVARALGAEEIEAFVERWELSPRPLGGIAAECVCARA